MVIGNEALIVPGLKHNSLALNKLATQGLRIVVDTNSMANKRCELWVSLCTWRDCTFYNVTVLSLMPNCWKGKH